MAIFNSKLLVYQRVEPPCEGHGTAASWKNVFWHDPSSRHCRCSSSGASALRDTLVMAWHERIMDRSWRIEASKEQTLLTLLCWITLFKHPHVKYVWNMYGICKYIYINQYLTSIYCQNGRTYSIHGAYGPHWFKNLYLMGHDMMSWCDTIFTNLYPNMVYIEYGNKNRYSSKVWLKYSNSLTWE